MFGIVLGKIKNNPWLAACLLAGNILLIAAASAIPMYAEAITQRVFIKELENVQIETGRYPGLVTLSLDPTQVPDNGAEAEVERFTAAISTLEDNGGEFNVPVTSLTRSAATRDYEIKNARQISKLKLYSLTDGNGIELLSQVTTLIAGSYPQRRDDATIEVVATEETFIKQNFLLGERYEIKGLKEYTLEISGVIRSSDSAVSQLNSAIYADSEVFDELFLNSSRIRSLSKVQWDVKLDYHAFRVWKLDSLLSATDEWRNLASNKYYKLDARFETVSKPFPEQRRRLNLTLWVLETPIFILLAFFISMVARQILSLDRNEISVMKSRGATRRQIFGIYLLMNVILAVVGLIIGVPVGMAVCGALGAANGFLELVSRAGLRLRLQPFAVGVAALAALASTAVCVLPAVGYSKITIVEHKRGKAHGKTPLWQRLFIDVILAAFALYIGFIFNSREASATAGVDPLLFLSTSLFILGAGLFFVRVVGYVIKLIYLLGKRWWSPALYTAFLKVIRGSGEEQFIMLFLVMTLATGIFSAGIARTVNANSSDALRYVVGADAVVKEDWKVNTSKSVSEVTVTGDIAFTDIVYEEPDFSRYTGRKEFQSATKVYRDASGWTSVGSTIVRNIDVYGIVTNEFGQIAWLRDGLLPAHFNDYLNALAVNPEAIIVSTDFRDEYDMRLGDRVSFTVSDRALSGVICGFADYWPGYEPTYVTTDFTGQTVKVTRPLIVANLQHLQRQIGVLPYEVWLTTDDDGAEALYSYAQSGAVKYRVFSDLRTKLVAAKNEPVLQGTNGVLTVGFLIVLLVCAVGFLIYWILSMRSRELQFGIFRAMGLSIRELISVLLTEQLLISGTSILAGVGVGAIASKLYVPLIQVGYATGTHLPLVVASDGGDYVRLLAVTLSILAVCMVVLGVLLKRLKVAQALKLGED